MSKTRSDGFFIFGLGILGYLHELIISDALELFPALIFGLMLIKGITRILEKTAT